MINRDIGRKSAMLFSKLPAVNLRPVIRGLGALLMVEVAFMLIPLVLSLCTGDSDWRSFAWSAVITAISGAALYFPNRTVTKGLGRREGCLLTSLVWTVFSLFGGIPFMLGSSDLNFSEAYFEAMSGFTTTGATVIRDIEACGKSIMLWRSLTQWLGGLGIVMFTIAIFPSLNSSGGLTLYNAETSGITHDKLRTRIASTARVLWGLYGALTVTLILLLWAGGMPLFESICNAMATISTGGYSTRSDSMASFATPYIMVVMTIFMFIGGLNFSLLYAAVHGHWRQVWRNDVVRAYVVMVLVNTIIVSIMIVVHGYCDGWESVTVMPLFHVVSAMTSTGMGAGNFEAWGPAVMGLTIIMMYIGACAGSTTGGAKIDRMLYLMKSFRAEVKRSVRPRAVIPVRINGMYVRPERGNEIFAFMTIFTSLIILGGMALTIMDFPIGDSFFAAFSCMANNGLGAGMTGISGSYNFLPDPGKWIMSFLMLAGRLEVFTVIVLFAPDFWKK